VRVVDVRGTPVNQGLQQLPNARRGTLDASPLLRLPVGFYFLAAFFAAFFATFLAAFFVAILPVLPVIKRMSCKVFFAANEGIVFAKKSVKKNR
jgi:hypothetical protein